MPSGNGELLQVGSQLFKIHPERGLLLFFPLYHTPGGALRELRIGKLLFNSIKDLFYSLNFLFQTIPLGFQIDEAFEWNEDFVPIHHGAGGHAWPF